MVHRDGKWWYKGIAYDTIHEALLSVWPRQGGGWSPDEGV